MNESIVKLTYHVSFMDKSYKSYIIKAAQNSIIIDSNKGISTLNLLIFLNGIIHIPFLKLSIIIF